MSTVEITMLKLYQSPNHLKAYVIKISWVTTINQNREMVLRANRHWHPELDKEQMLAKRNKTSLISWDRQGHQVKALATQNEFLREERPLRITILSKGKFKHFMDTVPRLKFSQMCLNLTNHNQGKRVKWITNWVHLKIKKITTMLKDAKIG